MVGIATYGSFYIVLAAPGGPDAAMHAFAVVNAAFAGTAFIAAFVAAHAAFPKKRTNMRAAA